MLGEKKHWTTVPVESKKPMALAGDDSHDPSIGMYEGTLPMFIDKHNIESMPLDVPPVGSVGGDYVAMTYAEDVNGGSNETLMIHCS